MENPMTRIAILLITLFGFACSSDDGLPEPSTPPAAGTMSTSETAARDNLDRSLVSCRDDGDCPRGAHCALQACSYECASDADCVHGRSCDPKGRCR
jgi:hypothetical protein